MELEKRIEILEKKVAELEGRVQVQPKDTCEISLVLNIEETIETKKLVELINHQFIDARQMKNQQFDL